MSVISLRAAFRRLAQRPALTFATISLAAVALAVTTALFSLVDSLFLRPLPFRDPGRLLSVQVFQGRQGAITLSRGDVDRLGPSAAFEAVEAIGMSIDESGDEEEGLRRIEVTPGLFAALGIRPYLGEGLTDDEPDAVVVGYEFWQRRFGGDASVVGRVVGLDGRSIRLRGVMPQGFDFPHGANCWRVPSSPREFRCLRGVARLRQGVSLTVAASMWPSLQLQPLGDELRPRRAFIVIFLFVATALTGLVTWGQIALLQLAAAVDRVTEYGVRVALGASNRDLLLDSAADGTALALPALLMGWALVPVFTQMVVALLPPQLMLGHSVNPGWRTLLFAFFASFAGLIVCSVATGRLAIGVNPAQALRGATAGRLLSSGGRMRSALVLAQVFVTSALLYVTGVSVQSLSSLLAVEPGFTPDGLFAVVLPWTMETIRTPDGGLTRLELTLDALRRLPGTKGVGGTDAAPLTSGMVVTPAATSPSSGSPNVPAFLCAATADYLPLLGARIIAGRGLTSSDVMGSPAVAVVTPMLLAHLRIPSPGLNHNVWIGARLYRIVGVVEDLRAEGPDVPPRPVVYVAARQQKRATMQAVVRRASTGVEARRQIQAALASVWQSPTKIKVLDLAAEYRARTATHRARSTLLLVLALASIGLSAVGLLGAVSHVVRQRRRELAIRITLGADPRFVGAHLLVDSLRLVAAGLAGGLAAGVGVVKWAQAVFFGVAPVEVPVLAGVGVAFLLLLFGAAAGPILQAARSHPGALLRSE